LSHKKRKKKKKKKKMFEAKLHRKVRGKILVIKLIFLASTLPFSTFKTSFLINFIAPMKASHHRLHHS